MCASYGLGGGALLPTKLDFDPLDERENRVALNEWMAERKGSARITGSRARNLNPIIRAGDDGREMTFAWWWLWYGPSGPVDFSAFNSRDDKLLRSWKRPFQTRALLPATWYVEKKKRFGLPDDELFGIAAITNTVELDDGSTLVTYSMVTRAAVGEAAGTHSRMPLVLPRSMHHDWLDPERPGDENLVTEIQHGSEEISRAMTAGSAEPTLF